jgi:MFS family permease
MHQSIVLYQMASSGSDPVKLGLAENKGQFLLLLMINAFVGGMVGMERSILPQIAEQEFHIAARSAILSFIIAFGIAKAATNYVTGTLADRTGRKKLLVAGWILALPVPFLLMLAPNWKWVVAANILLGVSQGFTWSTTVMMKIDLVGEKQRGLAMGLNEFAGYLAVAVVAFFTGWLADRYGLRPYPFYVGIGLAIAGVLSSLILVRDTRHHVNLESVTSTAARLKHIFWDTTWRHKSLGSVTQAGLVNNLNDGMMWGLFPILLASKGYSLKEIGIIVALYPAVWGITQLITGKLADHFCKRDMLVSGMILQGMAILAITLAGTILHFVTVAVLLGIGTALVYPTFLAAIAANTHPTDRPKSLGIFRFWRDLGYAIGAILTGIIADRLGIYASIIFIGVLTLLSGIIIMVRMKCSGKTPGVGSLLRRAGISNIVI